MRAPAIIGTKRTSTFTLPGIGKLFPSKPNSHLGRNPAKAAEVKIPANRVGKMKGVKVDGGGDYSGIFQIAKCRMLLHFA
jgi:hypothetical protein